jgi:hypothetical protein
MHIGAVVYIFDDYHHESNLYLKSWEYTPATVVAGLKVSVMGIAGYVLGTVSASRFTNSYVIKTYQTSKEQNRKNLRTHLYLIGIGLVATFAMAVSSSFLGSFSGLTAVFVAFRNALVFGVCGLIFILALTGRRNVAIIISLCACMLIIGAQAITSGILGDSIFVSVSIISFMLILFAKKVGVLRGILFSIVILYLSVVCSLAWLSIREGVRQTVLNESTNTSDRLAAVAEEIVAVGPLLIPSTAHFEFLDARLNHNVTIGKIVEHLEVHPELFKGGWGLLESLIAWVPRAIMPNKPERGGSEIVSLYTGLTLSETSSFGSGPIFDFYINFGTAGVLAGCFFFGAALRWLDIRCAESLVCSNQHNALLLFFVAINMVTPFETVFWIVNGIVSSLIAGWVILIMINLFSASHVER